MNQDVQPLDSHPASPAGVVAPPTWTWLIFFLIAPFVLWVGFSIGQKAMNVGLADGPKDPDPVEVLPDTMFRGWDKPEMVIVFSGQTFGYLQPCGCSNPQIGGLARRYNFIQMLKKRGWPVAAIDLGELYPKRDPKKLAVGEQEKEKFRATLKSLALMDYVGYGIGESELKMPLALGLADAAALNLKDAPRPFLSNLNDPGNIFSALGGHQYRIVGGQVKVGIANLVAPSMAKKFIDDPNLKFHSYETMLEPIMKQFAKANVAVSIVLLQSDYDQDPAVPAAPRPFQLEVKQCAELVAQVKQRNNNVALVDLIGHTSDQDNPPGQLEMIKGSESRSFYLGHNGKYVGVLGVFRQPNNQRFLLKYELVPLSPIFATPKHAQANHPVMNLIEEYAKTVKDRDFLAAYAPLRHPHETQRDPALLKAGIEAKFVGSDRCGDCHPHAFKVWTNSKHSQAFDTLVKDKNPSHRQHDPDCVICHTVGFKHPTGYYDPPAGANAKKVADHNMKLRHVGCENCHGPGSMHANDPKNKNYYPLINPLTLGVPPNPQKLLKLDFFCFKCHDTENDVHWGAKNFNQMWKGLEHSTPKPGGGN